MLLDLKYGTNMFCKAETKGAPLIIPGQEVAMVSR